MRYILVLCIVFVLSVSSRALAQSTNDPSPNQFVDVSEEPHETIPLEKLIVYPEVARRNGLEGKVVVDVLVGKDGRVDSVIVMKSTNNIFKDAAINAMQREKFTPAMLKETPLKIWITRSINFKLGNDQTRNDLSFEYFQSLMGSGKAQVLGDFQLVGNTDENEKTDGIYLHAESPDGFSEGGIPASMDGVIGDNGLHQLTIFYRCENDDDFNATVSLWNINKFNGGKLTSVSANVEFPNMVMSIASDAQKRTLRIVLKSK